MPNLIMRVVQIREEVKNRQHKLQLKYNPQNLRWTKERILDASNLQF